MEAVAFLTNRTHRRGARSPSGPQQHHTLESQNLRGVSLADFAALVKQPPCESGFCPAAFPPRGNPVIPKTLFRDSEQEKVLD